MQIEVSPGDVIDRLTILEIKLERIADPAKQAFVTREYTMLTGALAAAPPLPGIEALRAALKAVNLALWEVEDALRAHEAQGDFGAGFVELARSVYRHNDRRAGLKQEINALAGSLLDDVKSYTGY